MGQRPRYAAVQDARINPNVEESVGDMVQTVLTMDPLLLDQNTRRLPTATVTLPHQRTAGASDEVSAKIPGEVVICQEIVEV